MSMTSSGPSSSSGSSCEGSSSTASGPGQPSEPSGQCRSSSGGSNKDFPVTRGLLWYFPDACREVSRCSKVCNDQHNPGQPMHWAREKSTDHEDCIARHLIAANKSWLDSDGIPHMAKVAWRAMAALQVACEERAIETAVDRNAMLWQADLEADVHASLCPYADPVEEARRRARVRVGGVEPC